MQLKTYQENAIEDLLEKAKKLLAYSGGVAMVLNLWGALSPKILSVCFLEAVMQNCVLKKITTNFL